MTRYNKSEIMRQAHNYRRAHRLTMSDALRAAWLWAKSRNIAKEMDALDYNPLDTKVLLGIKSVDWRVKDKFTKLGYQTRQTHEKLENKNMSVARQ